MTKPQCQNVEPKVARFHHKGLGHSCVCENHNTHTSKIKQQKNQEKNVAFSSRQPMFKLSKQMLYSCTRVKARWRVHPKECQQAPS